MVKKNKIIKFGINYMTQGVKGMTINQRLMEKVEINQDNDCWQWTASKNNIGYGMFRISQYDGMMTAHRAMYEDHYKTKVPRGLCVMHTCGNYSCVNPDHLKLGTRQDITNLMKQNDRLNFSGNRKHMYNHCKHCGLFTSIAMLARWHDDKCKKKP